MFADPELVVVQFVEPRRQFEIALKLKRRMLADWMMRREEHAKAETLGHNSPYSKKGARRERANLSPIILRLHYMVVAAPDG